MPLYTKLVCDGCGAEDEYLAGRGESSWKSANTRGFVSNWDLVLCDVCDDLREAIQSQRDNDTLEEIRQRQGYKPL